MHAAVHLAGHNRRQLAPLQATTKAHLARHHLLFAILEQRLQCAQLVEQAAQAPHVCRVAVLPPSVHLWSHVLRRANLQAARRDGAARSAGGGPQHAVL